MRRVLALATVLALGFCGPAEAAFRVCNKTGMAARVAIGRFDGRQWSSQGWWAIAAGQCADLLTGPLDARYYYLYATDGATGIWDGHTFFCTAPSDKFVIPGRDSCAARGYDHRGFFQVDTGQSPDWTQTLSN